MQSVAQSLAHILHDPSMQGFVPVLRAGLWKPRSSPASFRGVGAEGLPWLTCAAHQAGLPAATEVAQPEHLMAAYNAGIRHFWIGARTTSNPFMVEALAVTELPSKQDIVWYVKNPTSPDVELWCGAIERLSAAGYTSLRAVHRGFAMGEHATGIYRNTPMWSLAIEFKRRYPDIPLLTDVSHMAGKAEYVATLAQQAMRMGMNGLMIEVHPHPQDALSDAGQQITPQALADLLHKLVNIPCEASIQEQTELTALRQQIDEADDELWALLVKRMSISRRIGEYKRRQGISVLQQARYDELLKRRMQWAAEHGIDPEAAKQIMDIIHEQSVLAQI